MTESMTIPELIQVYRREYTRTTGKELFCCSYSHGWFRVGDDIRVRLHEFKRMIDVLTARPNHDLTFSFSNINSDYG